MATASSRPNDVNGRSTSGKLVCFLHLSLKRMGINSPVIQRRIKPSRDKQNSFSSLNFSVTLLTEVIPRRWFFHAFVVCSQNMCKKTARIVIETRELHHGERNEVWGTQPDEVYL